MQKVLITGGFGYIGSNFYKLLDKKKFDVYCFTNKKTSKKNFYFVDIRDKNIVKKHILKINPEIIFHTAAISSLSICEKDKILAKETNIDGTSNIIRSIKEVNPEIKLIFISSDYVFDGEKGNYKEEDVPNPKTYYGITKYESEKEIKNKLFDYIIVRTANVFGKGGNFFNYIITNLESNKRTDVYGDVYFTPTYITFLIKAILSLIKSNFKGIIHIAGKEKVSRYDFALKISKCLTNENKLIIKTFQPKDSLIAKDSSLNLDKLKSMLNFDSPSIIKSIYYNLGFLIEPYFSFKDIRGKFIGIDNKRKWEEINMIDSIKGAVRGGHYHDFTFEGFCIIKGKVKVILQEFGSINKHIFYAEEGDIFFVKPKTTHTLEIINKATWINYLSRKIDNDNPDIKRP